MALYPGLDYLIKWYMRQVAGPLSATASVQKWYALQDANTFWVSRGRPHETMNGRLLSMLRAGWNPTPPVSDYEAVVLADNPLGYWRLDDAAGSVAANLGSGLGPGTYTAAGTPQDVTLWVPRTPPAVASGQAVTLAPFGSYLQVPPGLFSGIDFSCELWFKAPAAGHSVAYLVDALGPSPVLNLQIIWNDNATLTAHRRNAAGVMNTINTPAVALDVWHHVVYVRLAGIQLALFVDGVLAGSIPDTAGSTPISDIITVGGDPTGTNFTGGMIDEVALYATALTPARIAAHYAARL